MNIALSDELLSDRSYGERTRLRGYNGKVNVFSACTTRDAANVLITANRRWRRQDHARLAKLHNKARELQQQQYERLLDEASMKTFGRSFEPWDYQVCCIGREEFDIETKSALRYHGYAASKHKALAAAHSAAAASRRPI